MGSFTQTVDISIAFDINLEFQMAWLKASLLLSIVLLVIMMNSQVDCVSDTTSKSSNPASTTAPWVDMNLDVTSAGNVPTGTSLAAAPASFTSFNIFCSLVLVIEGTRMS